jgi:plasmid stability protein
VKTHALTLTDDLHARVRAEAAARRLSLGDTIRALLEAALTVVTPQLACSPIAVDHGQNHAEGPLGVETVLAAAPVVPRHHAQDDRGENPDGKPYTGLRGPRLRK